MNKLQQIVMILVVLGCVVVTDAQAQDGKSIPVLQSDGDLKLRPGNSNERGSSFRKKNYAG